MYKIAQILYNKTSHWKLRHRTGGWGYRIESEWTLYVNEMSRVCVDHTDYRSRTESEPHRG